MSMSIFSFSLKLPALTHGRSRALVNLSLGLRSTRKLHFSGIPSADNGAGENMINSFKDPRWVGGTWDLNQFAQSGETHWDAVIHAEVNRRKSMQDNPEPFNREKPIIFHTSIIPWWAWMKRFHLPQAELLNGRAAMIGFFIGYFVDSLTGIGLVDQTSNIFCKILLFIVVGGVLLIRENKDVETLQKFFEETTLFDKQ